MFELCVGAHGIACHTIKAFSRPCSRGPSVENASCPNSAIHSRCLTACVAFLFGTFNRGNATEHVLLGDLSNQTEGFQLLAKTIVVKTWRIKCMRPYPLACLLGCIIYRPTERKREKKTNGDQDGERLPFLPPPAAPNTSFSLPFSNGRFHCCFSCLLYAIMQQKRKGFAGWTCLKPSIKKGGDKCPPPPRSLFSLSLFLSTRARPRRS